MSASVEAVRALIDGGCDVIEVGLPYSDPMMDGPNIQAATQQALDAGTRIADVFRVAEFVATRGAPPLVMTYWAPVERYGVEKFAADLASAGGAGLVTPDLTPDSGADWIQAADARSLDKVFLVAPSSTDERLTMTARACRGFVYAAGLMGVTGERDRPSDESAPLVARARAASEVPVCVGLGVRDASQAARIAAYADGVIVGSAFVSALRRHRHDRAAGMRAVGALARELADAMGQSPSRDS